MGQAVRHFLRDLWALTRPYWYGDDRWKGLGLLAVVVALNLAQVAISVWYNDWNGRFFNALQEKNEAAFWASLWEWAALVSIFLCLGVPALYLRLLLQIRWRSWLTERFLARWLDARVYYRIALTDRGTDNPDQRIAEDIKLFIDASLALTLGFISNLVNLIAFLGILWGLSGTVSIFGVGVPGFLVWIALLYALLGTWATHLIGRPLIALTFDQQRFEADFRFGLVRFRENAEAIALYRGEADEKRGFLARFGAVVANWRQLMTVQKNIYAIQRFYTYAASLVPIIAAAPRYFADKDAQLGLLTQTANAFGEVQGSLSFFLDSYRDIATWKAVVDRLTTFEAAIARAQEQARDRPGVALSHEKQPALRAEVLTLALPDGRKLIEDQNVAIAPGERVLVTGPSGSGKSTLFRAFAGIWPFGAGRVVAPDAARPLFLPQKPYLPIGTIGELVRYPRADIAVDRATLEEALDAVALGHLKPALDERAHWQQRLSGGEQQRLAIARALVQKPTWLFLDEATSAVDEAAEERLYRLLHERLPDTTIVSIGHRATLRRFHRREIAFTPREGGGPARLADSPLPQPA